MGYNYQPLLLQEASGKTILRFFLLSCFHSSFLIPEAVFYIAIYLSLSSWIARPIWLLQASS